MQKYTSAKGRLLSVLLFLLLTSPLYAQEAKQDLIYSWNNFSGGLVTKVSPFLLERSQADVCENIRLGSEFGSLTKRDEVLLYGTADSSEAILGMHRGYLKDGTKVLVVNHGDEIEKGTDSTGAFSEIFTVTTGDYRWQWLTWNNILIGVDGRNNSIKYDGSAASATVLGACLATDAGSGTGLNGNSYKYKTTYYTSSYDVDLGVVSNVISVASKDVSVSMIPLGPDSYGGEAVVGRRIYRTTLAAPTTYYYAKTLADNITVSYTDSTGDAALGTALGTYKTITTTYTPATGELCVVHKNRLWIANNANNPSRIHYSEDGNHDVFVSTSYFDIRPDDGDEITFAKNLLGGLWIGKNNSIQRMYTEGSDPLAEWGYSAPYSFIGCQAMYSAVNTPLGIIYLNKSGEGLYKFNGHSSSLVSSKITPTIRNISDANFTNSWGEFHENKYNLAYTSQETGATTNDRVLIYDLIDDTFTIDLLSRNAFCVFGSGSDWGVLYSGASDDGRVYAHAITTLQMIHKKHSDFDDGTFTRMRYLPTDIGGDADDPVIEICRHATIDALTGTINAMTGDVNRSDANGNFISPVQHLNASAFVKLFWNELMTSTGGATTEVLFYVRASDTVAKCRANSWSTSITDPSGSDISGVSANTYAQYRIEMSSSAVDYTPLLQKVGGYVTRLTYNQQGAAIESTIPLTYRTGWTNLGYPGYEKTLTKVYSLHESEAEAGTLTLTFENLEGDTDVFEIDLSENPTSYTEYFTGGKMLGEFFRLNITENSINDLKIRRIVCVFDIEPLY